MKVPAMAVIRDCHRLQYGLSLLLALSIAPVAVGCDSGGEEETKESDKSKEDEDDK